MRRPLGCIQQLRRHSRPQLLLGCSLLLLVLLLLRLLAGQRSTSASQRSVTRLLSVVAATFIVMSSPDSKLLQEMWAGRVPVHFSLAPHEITSMEPPLPTLLLLPRQSYLPLCTDAVRRHFLPSAPAVEDELWYEGEGGSPMRWTLPIGVLMDIAAARQQWKHDCLQSALPSPSSPSPSPSHLLPLRDPELPFRLTVHFQQFPSKRLLRCRSLHTVRQHFLNSLKEATFIKQGHVKSVMQATPKEHHRLWESLCQLQHDAFNAVAVTLSPPPPPLLSPASSCSLPVRCFLVGWLQDEAELLEREAASGQHELQDLQYLPLQRPVQATQTTTLEDTLRQVVGEAGGGGLLAADSDWTSSVQVLVQGVVASLATPIDWLYRHCAHPDAFLYIVALRRR